ISFKMEAAIQLIADSELNVTLVPPALIKSTLASNPVPITFADTGLKVFQENAFITAYVAQLQAR
ncbi:MAG TPA: DUF3010 domain-containing protein, partial [Marinobacter hydrocarbonoclasticus]|nr:DUF3010 domain-containing protein [Marinobacter nauticus]